MTICHGPLAFESDEVQIKLLDLQITKETCLYIIKGKDICFTVNAINNSDIDVFGIRFSDVLEPNLVYVPGTFQVDGEFVTPMLADNIIQYPIDIPADGEVVIKFCVRVTEMNGVQY